MKWCQMAYFPKQPRRSTKQTSTHPLPPRALFTFAFTSFGAVNFFVSIYLRASPLVYLRQNSFKGSLVVSLEHPIHLSFLKFLFNFMPEKGV